MKMYIGLRVNLIKVLKWGAAIVGLLILWGLR
jgi:hypothetical protein